MSRNKFSIVSIAFLVVVGLFSQFGPLKPTEARAQYTGKYLRTIEFTLGSGTGLRFQQQ